MNKFDAKVFVDQFTSILYEALPFIILGAIIAGILEELVPQRWVTRILPRNRFLCIALGGLLGLLFPMCECGIIPVMRRLLRKGVPLSCCVCYMLAGPIINGVVMLSTFVAFNGMATPESRQLGSIGMVTMRVVLGYIVAFITALVVERQFRIYGTNLMTPLAAPDLSAASKEADEPEGPRPSIMRRISNISETSLHDFVDITVFLIIGALLAAFTRQILTVTGFDVATMSRNYPYLIVLVMMGLAIVLCLCSEADAFVAASFTMVPSAAKLGFLVLGPMLDFKLYMMFTRVFRPRLMWTIITSVLIQVFIISNLMNLLLQNIPISWFDSLTYLEQKTQALFGSGGP